MISLAKGNDLTQLHYCREENAYPCPKESRHVIYLAKGNDLDSFSINCVGKNWVRPHVLYFIIEYYVCNI